MKCDMAQQFNFLNQRITWTFKSEDCVGKISKLAIGCMARQEWLCPVILFFKVQVVYVFDAVYVILAAMMEETSSLFPFESKVCVESCNAGWNCVQPSLLSLFKYT